MLLPEFLPLSIRRATASGTLPIEITEPVAESDVMPEDGLVQFIQQQIQAGAETLYDDVIQRVERVMLLELRKRVDGNISRAAMTLGISRSTLRAKLSALGLSLN